MTIHAEAREKAKFYQIGTEKFIELSLCSFGLYSFYWTYANWQQIQRQGENISPLWRTLLAIVYQFDLYRRIHSQASEHQEKPRWQPVRIYVLWVVFTVMPIWLLLNGHPWGSIVLLLSLLPNLLANQSINRLHDHLLHFYAQNTDLKAFDWGIIVAGLIVWLTLLVAAIFY